jgi:hypothetical protein
VKQPDEQEATNRDLAQAAIKFFSYRLFRLFVLIRSDSRSCDGPVSCSPAVRLIEHHVGASANCSSQFTNWGNENEIWTIPGIGSFITRPWTGGFLSLHVAGGSIQKGETWHASPAEQQIMASI